jgi:hypothetical protein
LLATELKDFETISVVHPQQAADCRISPHVVLLNTRTSRRAGGALRDDIALIASATHQAPVLLLSDGEARPKPPRRASMDSRGGFLPVVASPC